jgi:hypothetical protein
MEKWDVATSTMINSKTHPTFKLTLFLDIKVEAVITVESILKGFGANMPALPTNPTSLTS